MSLSTQPEAKESFVDPVESFDNAMGEVEREDDVRKQEQDRLNVLEMKQEEDYNQKCNDMKQGFNRMNEDLKVGFTEAERDDEEFKELLKKYSNLIKQNKNQFENDISKADKKFAKVQSDNQMKGIAKQLLSK